MEGEKSALGEVLSQPKTASDDQRHALLESNSLSMSATQQSPQPALLQREISHHTSVVPMTSDDGAPQKHNPHDNIEDGFGDNVEDVTDAANPLPVQQEASDYTDNRLKQALNFADSTLRNKSRKVSPVTSHMLAMYKCAVKDVLLKSYNNEEEKKTIVLDIMTWERTISTNEFLRGPGDDIDFDLLDRLCLLRRYEFAARYGDYMKEVCEKLKVSSRELKKEYFEELNGWNKKWTDIKDALNREHHAYRRFQNRDPAVTDEEIKTTIAVERTCAASGQNVESVLQSISMYADRKSLVHMSTLHMIENGMWHKLRECLCRDLKDLPKVTPANFRHTIPITSNIINGVIDTYFKRNEKEPDNMNYWDAKAEAYERAAQLKEVKKHKMALVAAERSKVAELAEKRFKDLVHKHTFVNLAAAVSGLQPPTGQVPSLKRPRNEEEHSNTLEVHKRRNKAWSAMVNSGKQTYKKAADYVQEYGSLEAPIDPEVWLDLVKEDHMADEEKAAETSGKGKEKASTSSQKSA
ncbi:hypothetical protein LTR47_005093 [Exophiala xenobiotica]|nr:hypothetical protein LTR47_005093 [Exophiala xenobiotica]KAK5246370.1 hypothetical protein LTS06_008318 [Exophiala xenobiotica]KAK5326641.1 hypothetical protein LTR93_003504 [Exophiala xenobiotica]KAK5353332.1 hypothetical protein LTR61_003290 [Exophiala xenobiotica]KAK5380113.1 hypothetical protein LTR11_003742 [Exophiala xenobiotica]